MGQESLNLGVIEGFYGRPWDPGSRLLMPRWLAGLGLSAYLYAPKADPYLRKAWRERWPAPERNHLYQVARRAEECSLTMHVGLSPFALYSDYNGAARKALRDKVAEIVDLGVRGLAVLFDDMPGDTPDLAARQALICADIEQWSSAAGLQLSVCPTYYSDDAILDSVFGERPAGYLEELTAQLGEDYTMFWTGPQVCAATIEEQHIVSVAQRCSVPLALWDNYPVNDSRARSPHLYIEGFTGRSAGLARHISAHWCNAMNQPALSLPALAALAALYGRQGSDVNQIMAEAGVTDELRASCAGLDSETRETIGATQLAALRAAAKEDTIAAGELRDWLSGAYEFDPACLTD